MDSNHFDDEQFNNNTWDENQDHIACPSPLLLGHPQIKNYSNEDERSLMNLINHHTDIIFDEYNQQNKPSQTKQPLIKKSLHKSKKKTSLRKIQNNPSVKKILNSFPSDANKPSEDNTIQQILYCQQMQQLIDNLEGILSTIKQKFLNQYSEQITYKI